LARLFEERSGLRGTLLRRKPLAVLEQRDGEPEWYAELVPSGKVVASRYGEGLAQLAPQDVRGLHVDLASYRSASV